MNGHEEVFDAGPIFPEYTPRISHTFLVHNFTRKTMRIAEVRRSCTCTEADLSTREIPPGGGAELRMSVNARNVLNDWDVTCTLVTDTPKHFSITRIICAIGATRPFGSMTGLLTLATSTGGYGIAWKLSFDLVLAGTLPASRSRP